MKRASATGIMALYACLSACGSDSGDIPVRENFQIWHCNSSASLVEIEEGVRSAAQELDLELSSGNITQGGAGLVYTLGKGGLEVNVLVMGDGGNIGFLATHNDIPREVDREIVSNLIALLPTEACRQTETPSDLVKDL